jgi:hypothetical protein
MDSVTVEGATDLSSKPSIAVDTAGEPPTQLVSEDLVAGDGPELAPGAVPSERRINSVYELERKLALDV